MLLYSPIQWPSPDGIFPPAEGAKCLSYLDDVQMQLHRQSGCYSPSSLAQFDKVPKHNSKINDIDIWHNLLIKQPRHNSAEQRHLVENGE